MERSEDRLAHYRGLVKGGEGVAPGLRAYSAEAASAAKAGSLGEGGCVYAEPECRGCRNRPKVRCHEHALILPAARCSDCRERLPLSELRIGAVITAWNEGDEVAATIKSLRASVRHAHLTVVLVDDGSTDGSCAALSASAVRVVRHSAPAGVGRGRNEGWSLARDAGCHVVTFHDGHMRFDADTLEALAVKAVQERCIVSSASRGIPSKGTLCGCWMHYDSRYGLQPKWQTGGPEGWYRTPCMMGAGYVVSRETGLALETPTGSLWEDTAGRWGFSEQALSVKAYLLGIPVLTNRALALAHLYRSRNPVPNAAREVWKNVARGTALLFGHEVYEERFAAWCEAHVPGNELEPILAKADEDAPAAWPVDPATVWTHLLGEDAPIEATAARAAKGSNGRALPSPAAASVGPDAAVNHKPGTRDREPVVTVCLLSWKRPDNLSEVLDSIAAQTVPARIMLWNNGQRLPIPGHPLLDVSVQAGSNLGCFPRWWLASVARTEWVCSLDDDLAFAAPDALEAALAAAEQCPGIVGAYGVQLAAGQPYKAARHIHLPAEDVRVDIVKGRFMLFRRALLERAPLLVPALDELGKPSHREDDIYVSLCIGDGRATPHLLPGALRGKLRELPHHGVSVSAQPGHYERRQRTIEVLREWIEEKKA